MNTLSNDIQSIIYKLINQDAIKRGFAEILPFTSTSSPFKMDIIDFTRNKGIVECVRFQSDLCRMCYSRGIKSSHPLDAWIRCSDILHGINDICTLDNVSYEHVRYNLNHNEISHTHWHNELPVEAKINAARGNLYWQYFKFYEYCMEYPEYPNLKYYNPDDPKN